MPRIDFDKLTKAEQRVVIAKDLIARLRAGKFEAESGTYLDGVEISNADDGAELRGLLKGQQCRGCQIGGMFLAAIDRHNKLKVGDVYGVLSSTDMRIYLSRWFSLEQLSEVESAFETETSDYVDWGGQLTDAQRMTLIAQNIIKNKGKFVGKQLLASS